ncbi:MAG: hypothetical protein C4B59_11870 [Candidatus Methanogaster sp.]|uniref:Uncharacterized protein n=1 Tax=Candidatus Methanogaster sp. TaxID=3386292 RepID=A0AC61L0X8_9EURY|nr:MAG: hypothetical protein C4B59_11870 [ANME-2 cluster archaeon]
MKKSHIALAILLLALLLPLASADICPKRVVQFNLIYETSEPVTLIDYRLIGYEEELCIREIEFHSFERFECAQKECRSSAFPRSYSRLIINFSDRERQSEVFNITNYGTEFDVHVTDSELIVEETTPILVVIFYAMPDFALFLMMTIILELMIALILVAVLDKPMKVVVAVLIANLISFPAFWQFTAYSPESGNFLILEAFVVVFEGFFIYYFMKKVMSIYQSLALSLILNLGSFLSGMILMFGLGWTTVIRFVPIMSVVIIISILALTYLKKRYSDRSIEILTISIMVLACAVTGLLVMDQLSGGPLLSAHKLSCEPEYYADITAEELQEFPYLAKAITQGKFIELSREEEDRLLDHIKAGQSEQHTSSSPQKLYVRVKDEYYEVRTTWI